MAALLAGAVGTDVGAALEAGLGGREQRGQRAHLFALRDELVRDPHHQAVEQRRRGTLQVRRGVAGVRGQALHGRALTAQSPVELQREEQVRQLRLSVRAPAEVVAVAVQVVEGDPAHLVRGARERHDTRVLAALHRVQEQRGEQEVPEVVGAELKLEAVRRAMSRRRHHARVVDQQVEPVVGGLEALGKAAHGLQAREIELLELHLSVRHGGADLVHRFVSLVEVAAGEDHARARARELTRRDQPEPAVRPSDDRDAPALIRDVLGGPALGHSSTLTGATGLDQLW